MSIYTPTAKICIDISAVHIQVQRADTAYSLSNQSPTLTNLPPLFKFNTPPPIQIQRATTDYPLFNESPTLTYLPSIFKFNALPPIQAHHAAADYSLFN